MKYTIYALKWRPQRFDDLVGQPHVVTTLKSALEKGRLGHSYLFAGPRGVGKTSTARILAKSVNCKEGPTAQPCQKCSACREIAEGRAFDVIEIDGASNRGIDEIRTLRENVKFAPTSGKYKVYIIDEVHMLTTEAFNALLKTLEEPPEYVKFIFATTHPHKVPPTILSRCHRLDFRRISAVEIVGQLERIVRQEKLKVDKDVLVAITRSCDGSLRDAESLLDQLVSFAAGAVSLKDVVSVLGLVEQEALFEIAARMQQGDARGALAVLGRVVDEGKDAGVFLSELIEHFRNLMVARVTGGDVELIDLPEEVCKQLSEQAGAFSMEELFRAFNSLVTAQEMAKRLNSVRIPLEVTLIKLSSHFNPGLQPRIATPDRNPGLQSGIEKTRATPVGRPAAEKPPEHNKDERPVQNITIEAVREVWMSLVKGLERVKISVAHYLSEGKPVRMQGGTVVVAFPRNLSLHKEALETRDNRELIEKGLLELMKVPVRLQFELSGEEKTFDEAIEHPFIKSALDVFGGRVLKEE